MELSDARRYSLSGQISDLHYRTVTPPMAYVMFPSKVFMALTLGRAFPCGSHR